MNNWFAGPLMLVSATALADVSVPMNLVSETGVGAAIGQVTVSESAYGLVLTPALQGLPPGLHGFHVHQVASCEPGVKDGKPMAAGMAGSHYDPDNAAGHGLPWGAGHRGDLPVLYVDANGVADQPVLAPRLKLADLKGRALVIHAGGDNHADQPKPLGGGGQRIACGVSK